MHAGVKYLTENILYGRDMRANAEFAAEFLLYVGRCRKMVCVNMRFNLPLQLKIVPANMVYDLVS
jgi:hypothetical protein